MFIFLILAIVFLVLWLVARKKSKKTDAELKAALSHVDQLARYQEVVDAHAEAQKVLQDAKAEADKIREDAKAARSRAKDANAEAQDRLKRADDEVRRMIAEAEAKARKIAGEAYDIKGKADMYSNAADAIRRTIEGYGDEWLKPTYSLLDELADEFSHTDAGKKLKDARVHTAAMVKAGSAAACNYAENYRRTNAIAFVVDAFNGKVDSILSQSKKENYGKLEQQIRDAFAIVNYNGKAFKDARITEEYLQARLEELKWAVIVKELRAKELEEQRQIREQMREEERARREYEKAQREAEKEAAMLEKAMEKAKKMLEKANAEERAQYEAQIVDLSARLKEAEEKGQHALSMAQQTKRGNVYVISNVGSFGENVYKVGMTRRLNPLDRVQELSSASVPFSFDVHAIIESDNAPALEHQLHQELALMQVNKVNPRKEFFRVPLSTIKALVESHGLNVTWTMAAEAAEYRETQAIEERMKSDPDAQARWEEFYSKLSSEEDEDEEDVS